MELNERVMFTEIVKGSPYRTKEDMARTLGITKPTLDIKMAGIEEQIKKGRYSPYSIIRDGKIVLVNLYVMLDYLKFKTRLEDKNMSKHVPVFNAKELAGLCGWY